MSTRASSDDQLEVLKGFPDIGKDELIRFFTLTSAGVAFVDPGRHLPVARRCMSCLHTKACPLFPHLRESLQSWRDYYCDSDQQWHDCARYKLSLTGQSAPITLLPNGRSARYITGSGTPAPASGQSTLVNSAPQPLDQPARSGRRAAGSGRGPWGRLIDWMKGSA